MAQRAYNVLVTVDHGDERATVTVNGTPYRYPWHWEDSDSLLARRAVFENYRVEQIESVERTGRGHLRVLATVF